MVSNAQLLVMGLVAVGGAAGSVGRYLVQGWLTVGDFPWGTFAVNVTGCFFISLSYFAFLQGGGLGSEARAFLFTGIFGGFTTMSAFGLDTVTFLGEGQFVSAGANVLLTVGLCLGGAVLGRSVGLWLGGV